MKRLSRQILEQILVECSEGVVVAEASDPDHPVVFANPAFEKERDGEGVDVIGEPLPRLLAERLGTEDRDRLLQALSGGEIFTAELEPIRGGGPEPKRRVRVTPLRARSGEISHFMMTQTTMNIAPREISTVEVGVLQREISRARQKLASMARVDPVTGVMRYEFFRETAERDFRVARRIGRRTAVILFEIVDLEAYRDTFGRKAAESCVRMVAAQMNSLLRRASDLRARVDDSTLAAMTQGQDVDEVRSLAQRIVENIRRLGLHNPRGRFGRYIDVEFGVAAGTPDGVFTLDAALAAARDDLESKTPMQNPAYGSGA